MYSTVPVGWRVWMTAMKEPRDGWGECDLGPEPDGLGC